MQSPSPEEIKKARMDAGLSQSESAKLIYKGLRTWQGWEAPQGAKGHRSMDPAFFELFKIKSMNNDLSCMRDIYGDEIKLTEYEVSILQSAKEIFASKDDYSEGGRFRIAFVKELMRGYCDHCGSGGDWECYCTRDD